MTYRFVAGGGATLPDDPHSFNRLTDEARSLIDGILQKADTAPVVGVNRWLLALAETQAPLIENLAGGLALEELRETLRRRLGKGDEGPPVDLNTLADRALEWAHRRGAARAIERDVVSVVLAAAGFAVAGGAAMPSSAPTSTQVSGPDPLAVGTAAEEVHPPYRPRAEHPTPTLDKLGWDLTRAALEGKLRPVVGRDEET
ncbi:MAG: hypothetical protein K6U08_09725, partial [Firmicutes bacterium]|nr:hypothetical protein [Bacillota bacterium]